MDGIGETLRNARVGRGLTIEQAAQDTRISPRFLEALEEEQFEALPAPVYVRGFLRSYANYLRLDATPLLARLQDGGAPVAGPDAFVGGPRPPGPGAPQARTDPFRPAPRPAPTPVPPVFAGESAIPEEEWSPEPPSGSPEDLPSEPFASGPGPEPAYPPEEAVFRPRRVAGVLSERDPYERDGGNTVRMLALAGVALIVILVGAIAVLSLTGGGGDDDSSPAAGETATPTPSRAAGTVIPVGSATPSATASPSPGASASPSPSGTPASPSPAETPATPTPPATTAPPKPTATPTHTPSPTPSPTATLPPPPPTNTPIPSHPLTYQECVNYSCGDSPPYRVVCVPDGTWFVDVAPFFPAENYGWTVTSVTKAGDAQTACP